MKAVEEVKLQKRGHRAQRGRGRATAWGHFWCWTVVETALYIGSAYWGARLLSQHP